MNGFASPAIDAIVLKGGLDLVTPTLSLGAGFARQSLNFEASVTGGYSRIQGYERFDGRPSPTDNSGNVVLVDITIPNQLVTLAVGDIIEDWLGTFSAACQGLITAISGDVVTIAQMVGFADWTVSGYNIFRGVDVVGVASAVAPSVQTTKQYAQARATMADYYRQSITAVTGVGSILGVVELNDVVYAFRGDVGGLKVNIYKNGTNGWSPVALYNTVSFTLGSVEPAEGSTLTQGAVTATIKRVVRTSGSWQAGTAAGQYIVSTPLSGHFTAGATTGVTTNGTLSGAETQITLTLGSNKFEFDVHNFSGQSSTTRIYGCDGVNKAFEFDGSILVPITTGATIDEPTHICAHKGFLFLSVGSSIMFSAPALPYDYTVLSGAGEIATGNNVTGMIVMAGGTTSATLGVFSRDNTYILYGTGTADWNLVAYNTGTGAVPYTAQNMAQTYVFDDRGVNSVQTALQYGNFTQSALTNAVLPFVNERIGKAVASTLCRRKSQYRVFFNDGYALFITVVNNTLMGCMPIWFPDTITCTYEGKKSDGTDVMYFGSDNGMVYQMEKGTSFDGVAIPYYFTTNYSNSKTPRTLKRYRKIVPEITSNDGTSYAEFDFTYQLGYGSPEYSGDNGYSYDLATGGNKWDTGLTWDTFYWDAQAISILECYAEGTAENIALLVNGSANYVSPFTINSFMVHYSPRRNMR